METSHLHAQQERAHPEPLALAPSHLLVLDIEDFDF